MTVAIPEFAIVRPRIIGARTGESLLLEDVIEEVFEECESGYLQITAGPGGGKTTAIAHLAAVFAHEERIACLDEPTTYEIEAAGDDKFVVFSRGVRTKHFAQLLLEPWGMDDLIEYALAQHHNACNSILERLGASAKHRWAPGIATIVLDRFAADAELAFPIDAIMQHVDEEFASESQRAAAAQYCLALLIGKGKPLILALEELKRVHLLPSTVKLMRHEIIQIPLATQQLCDAILAKKADILEHPLPRKVIRAVGRKCATTAGLSTRLFDLLNRKPEKAHAMAASILLAADPAWRPQQRRKPWHFADGIFAEAQWAGVDLTKALLNACDLSDTNLVGATLNGACIEDAHFERSDLSKASLRVSGHRAHFAGAVLVGAILSLAKLADSDFSEANLYNAQINSADLTSANLSMANLQQASLIGAQLIGANLEDADLTEADLRGANLTRVDLRHAALDGICLEEAMLKEAQLEDVRITGARLKKARLFNAYLTGSSLPYVDLQRADLRGAKLADIDWEGADLRGANLQGCTFHMGSSRSGLVNSPYPCEGSKTGFYTDDFDDLNYKRPEEIRKASLINADLRQVQADGVDFYLVDLRGAKMDAKLLEQARETGAILLDPER